MLEDKEEGIILKDGYRSEVKPWTEGEWGVQPGVCTRQRGSDALPGGER